MTKDKRLTELSKHNQFKYSVIVVFARHEGKLEKKGPDFFQIAIRFHPDHPWLKALISGFSALREQF